MSSDVSNAPDFIVTFEQGAVILWNYKRRERFELDDAHLTRIIARCRGSSREEGPIDDTIDESGIFDGSVDPRWKWDALARIFHFGTKAFPDQGELSEVEDYGGYLRYCASIASRMPDLRVRREGERVPLPAPGMELGDRPSLSTVLKRRKTCRDFDAATTTLQKVADVMFWTFGAVHGAHREDQREAGLVLAGYRRTSPSGGSLQSCEAFLVALNVEGLTPGVYHYDSIDHVLVRTGEPLTGDRLGSLLGAQMFARDLSFGVFITSRFETLWWKYPSSRAYRVALMDAGALMQTFLLSATALDFNTWVTGQFYDDAVNAALGVDGETETCLIFVGAGKSVSGSTFSRTAQHVLRERTGSGQA